MWIAHITDKNFVGETLELTVEFADSLELNVQLKSSQEEAKMAEAAAQADLIQ